MSRNIRVLESNLLLLFLGLCLSFCLFILSFCNYFRRSPMTLPYFSMDGILFLLRWFHIFFGVIWIGHLYYFNFVQGAFMKEAAAGAKPEVLGNLLPRALWWFRWGAFWTMATGIVLILAYAHEMEGFNNNWGVTIVIGAAMGLVMGSNVWFVIWPNQKLVIQNATGTAVPNVADAAAKALLASRTNVLLSIPMLFFMAASRHLVVTSKDEPNYTVYWIVAFALLALIEINALKGKLGPLETVKGVVTGGFILTAAYAILMAVLL